MEEIDSMLNMTMSKLGLDTPQNNSTQTTPENLEVLISRIIAAIFHPSLKCIKFNHHKI